MTTGEASAHVGSGKLYLVGTPIGNLQDLSFRALETLQKVNCIACEDTRVTSVLLKAHGIHTPLISYNDHNAPQRRPQLLARMGRGESLALVSDAGMPLISDPGYKLAVACWQAQIPVVVIPGPSAVLTALCGAGLPTDRFFFQGFLPSKGSLRQTLLEELQPLSATLIFFEASHRVVETLEAMVSVWGDRQAALGRELTKKFEETRKGMLSTLIEGCRWQPPRGEITLVVAGASLSQEGSPGLFSPKMQASEKILQALFSSHSLRDAADLVADATGLARRAVYQQALALRARGEEGVEGSPKSTDL